MPVFASSPPLRSAAISVRLPWTRPRLSTIVAFWTVVGLGLRLAAARGDLWLDEIWSYRLVARSHSIWSIVFALPYDNNHILNSVWLWLVGPDASSLVARLPAIIFGTLCIPVAAWLAARRAAALAPWGAALIALNGMFVEYGSEARGYAGLMLAGLLAIDGYERLDDDHNRRMAWWILGLATALGTFSHLTMVGLSLALGASAIVRASMRKNAAVAIGALSALAIGTLPALACLIVSVASASLHLGVSTAFSVASFVDGMGRLAEMTLGLPCRDEFNVAAACVAALCCAAGIAYVPPARRIFPVLAIFGLGAIDVLARIPNEQFPRYHLAACLGMIVLAIDVLAQAKRDGRRSELVVRAVVGILIVGQAYNLARLVHDGRGRFKEAVAAMGADGATSVAVAPDWMVGETRSLISWYADKVGSTIEVTPRECAGDVRWLVRLSEPTETLPRLPVYVSHQAGCSARFTLASVYPAYGLSGFTWLLYRREGIARDP